MPIQDAGIGTRVFERFAIEISQLGIDGSHRGDCVALAQGEDVLAGAGRVFDIQVDKSTVEQSDQREDGGEGAPRMQPFIYSVAALLKGEQANIGILDGEQLEQAAVNGVVFVAE